MSATVERAAAGVEVYARLHAEGRAEVLALLRSEFRDQPHALLEDVASVAMVEMLRARRMREWSTGAIGVWHQLSRSRMLDELRRPRRVELTERAEVALSTRAASTEEIVIEHTLGDWRAVELMAQMSQRAATYVRLRLLEGGRRGDVMAQAGWTQRQYEVAQSEALQALRKTLRSDGGGSCEKYRLLIDASFMGSELSVRKRIELRAHCECCASCKGYRLEVRHAVRGVLPLIELLLPAGAGGTAALAGAAAVGAGAGSGAAVALPTGGVLGKLLAGACVGVLCVGGTIAAVQPQDRPGPHQERPAALGTHTLVTRTAAASVMPAAPWGRSWRAISTPPPAPQPGRSARRTSPSDDALGLRADLQPRRTTTAGIDPLGLNTTSGSERAVPTPAPAAASAKRAQPEPCSPGELGC